MNTALNLTAHALWGAVEANAGNRNVAAGLPAKAVLITFNAESMTRR